AASRLGYNELVNISLLTLLISAEQVEGILQAKTLTRNDMFPGTQ
ncbi:uncharacterized, partial [Tachysurus ichikawai]